MRSLSRSAGSRRCRGSSRYAPRRAPHGLDARADPEPVEAFGDDVWQRGVGAVESHQHEGERRGGGMQSLGRLVHHGHRRDGARVLDRDPLAALGPVALAVAERRHDHALTRDALAPDATLVTQAGEEAADGLPGRVLVGKLHRPVGEHGRDGGSGHRPGWVVHRTSVCQGRRRSHVPGARRARVRRVRTGRPRGTPDETPASLARLGSMVEAEGVVVPARPSATVPVASRRSLLVHARIDRQIELARHPGGLSTLVSVALLYSDLSSVRLVASGRKLMTTRQVVGG